MAAKRFFLGGRVKFFSLVMIPVTSLSATMTFYIDNTADHIPVPYVHNQSVFALDESLTVHFTKSVDDVESYSELITSFPAQRLIFKWNEDNDTLVIVPRTLWKPDTRYTIAFPQVSGTADSGLSYMFVFQTVDYPQILSHSLQNDDLLTEGEEMHIIFDRDISAYDLHAVARPAAELHQRVDYENNAIYLSVSKVDQSSARFHNITIFAKYKNVDEAQNYPVASVGFRSYMEEPEQWPEEFTERLHVAERTTVPHITEGRYIDVNLDVHVTTLFENGIFVRNFVNSPGAKETPTPTGTYQIYNKDPYALSNMFGVYLPYWMAFTENGEYGFHDLIVWPEGHQEMPSGGKEGAGSIGNAVSPGCVRHDAEESRFIYDWTDIGTPVVIHE